MEAVLSPNWPDTDYLVGHLRRGTILFECASSPSGRFSFYGGKNPEECAVMEEARGYKDSSPETRIDDVETEEDAEQYLAGIRRRSEEGKTTPLP